MAVAVSMPPFKDQSTFAVSWGIIQYALPSPQGSTGAGVGTGSLWQSAPESCGAATVYDLTPLALPSSKTRFEPAVSVTLLLAFCWMV